MMNARFSGILTALFTLTCFCVLAAARSPQSDFPALSVTPRPQTPLPSIEPVLKKMYAYPCPDSEFRCVKISVPLDHHQPQGRKIEVVFAVLPAAGERKGMFVTAVGGPGDAGLQQADEYTDGYGDELHEHYDIVFFDQRGTGRSASFDCPQASAASEIDYLADTPAREHMLKQAARQFALDCVKESRKSDLLPYYSTAQAVEDLELFRKKIGEEKFWLYGLSYGTEFAQTYAGKYSRHLAGLILDGSVDLTLPIYDGLEAQAQAFNDVLVQTLQACNEDEDCAADAGGDALAVYDRLAARLRKQDTQIDFPLPDGKTAPRTFSLADLETVVTDNLYSESDRMILQRALAAAARNDLVPLLRLNYIAQDIDPQSGEVGGVYFSDAAYYAIECPDYYDPSLPPERRAAHYLRIGDEVDRALPRMQSIFYGDFACTAWPLAPHVTPVARSAYLTLPGVPVLVLGATADPATPYQQGVQIYRRLQDAYLITMQGGPHVIFGWGNSCPDDLVVDAVVNGEMPAQRETTCPGEIADAYIPLAPQDAAAFASPMDALRSAEDEITYLPEIYYWDGERPGLAGCPYGGTLSYSSARSIDYYRLQRCAFSQGFEMSGAGRYNWDTDEFSLHVEVRGLAKGELTYTVDADGYAEVSGEYGGETVDIGE